MGKAGNAFLYIANKNIVAVKPVKTAMVQQTVVIQSYMAMKCNKNTMNRYFVIFNLPALAINTL